MQSKIWKEDIIPNWKVFAKDVNRIFGKYLRAASIEGKNMKYLLCNILS